jgi:hypothetical protein
MIFLLWLAAAVVVLPPAWSGRETKILKFIAGGLKCVTPLVGYI